MRTRDEINDARANHGIIGTLEVTVELLFDIRNLLLTAYGDHESNVRAALLDSRTPPEDKDVGL